MELMAFAVAVGFGYEKAAVVNDTVDDQSSERSMTEKKQSKVAVPPSRVRHFPV